jgi:hypothetical protein
MQIPIMAIAVFMAGFIASAGFAVKAECGGRARRLLPKWRTRALAAGINQITLKALKTRQDSVSFGHHFRLLETSHARGE